MLNKMFKEPIPLLKEDVDLTVTPLKNYKHAVKLNAVALNYQEVVHASKHYPIFFAKDGEEYVPFAMLGFEDNSNLFIDKSKNWAENRYVPLLVRTYPFTLAKTNAETVSVVYDKTYDGINNKDDKKSFKMFKAKGEFTPQGEQLFKALEDNLKLLNTTKDIIKIISEMELFKTLDITIGEKEEKKFVLKNLVQIDAEKLNKLSDEQLLKLTKSSALHLIYNHLDSFSNFANLLERIKKLS